MRKNYHKYPQRNGAYVAGNRTLILPVSATQHIGTTRQNMIDFCECDNPDFDREGFIKLYRKSIKNPLFQKPLVWHFWVYCLLKANHEPKKIIWDKKEMTIDRGSFITGRKVAAQETGLSQQNIRTALNTLANLGMIEKSTSKSTSKFSYLTICNYNIFQDKKPATNQQINQQLTSNQPATNQQLTTNKNDKNIKNEKNIDICPELQTHSEQEVEAVNQLILQDGSSYNVIKANVEEWQKTFPALNVICEIQKMKSWLDANPKNRKTRKGIKRFIFNWLERGQNRASRQPQTPDQFRGVL